MDHNTLMALLGDTYDDTTDEQREAISRAADRIDARWPDADHEDTRRDALNASMAVILGDERLEDVSARWLAARAAEREAHAELTGALIACAGEPETRLAERAGVTRMTVRKALGK